MHAPFPPAASRRYNAAWLTEHCLGERLSAALTGGRRRAQERLFSSLEGVEGALEPAERLRGISAEEFVAEHMPRNRPLVLEGAAADWPCVRRWTPGFFGQRFPDEPIRLLNMTAADVGGRQHESVDTTLGQAIARLEEGNSAYCRFLPTLLKHADLQEDLDGDWFHARRGPWAPTGNYHLFIGGAGTETGAHAGISANLFVQIHGRKRWRIYSPTWAPVFDPPMQRAMYFVTRFDPDTPDYARYPGARHLRGYEVELGPGDVLYNPPLWWHKVDNPTISIGVGYRWFPPRLCFSASPIMWILTYLAVNPPVWRALKYELDFTRIFSDR